MREKEILQKINDYVCKLLKNEGTGHDFYHIQRVVKNVQIICESENIPTFYPKLLAYLHDVGDYKLHDGIDCTAYFVHKALKPLFPDPFIKKVINDIQAIGYKGGLNEPSDKIEVWIVQDADKLDAMGAIGIARAFAYGGSKNRLLHDPLYNTENYKTIAEYQQSTAPTIQHFYDKLLKLKDLMKTEKGKELAIERHVFMETFLEQFYKEWNI
ncbi:MAG: HD domain-containing protein [Weeksellaceae bacterium]